MIPFSGGSPSDGGVAYYGGVNENWHGPTTAVAALPKNANIEIEAIAVKG